MISPVLGIDLGTTNSVVAVADGGSRARVLMDDEGNRLVPSVVSFHPGGEVLTGYPARERRLVDAKNTIYSTKRLIGRPFRSVEVRRAEERFPFSLIEAPNKGVLVKVREETYTLPEISAFILRQVRTIAERALETECRRAVITVPANFTELQRSATKAAGKIAGLEVLRILNEPTAAALAYGYDRGTRERIAVYDMGGGTFDLTILDLAGEVFEVLSTAGDTFLGGDDIDLLIAEKMADAFLARHRFDPRQDPQAYERLRAAAEWSKCQLSNENEVHLRVEELAYGGGGASLDLTFSLTRASLEENIRPLIARTFDVCEQAMKIAKLRPTQLDTVILVGGSTRIPIVRQMVAEYFGREPLGSIDPDLVVAEGAAMQGWALREMGRPPTAPLARVALKRVTQGELKAAQRPREAGKMPAGPAFAPRDQGAPVKVPSPHRAIREEGPSFEHTDTVVDDGIEEITEMRSLRAPPAPPAPPLAASVVRAPIQPISQPPAKAAPLTLPPLPNAAQVEPARAVPVPMAPAPPLPRPPLLLDVTPHSLGVETVQGYCEHVIKRNAAIPVEQTRVFSTGTDMQESVRVLVVQGESRRIEDNQPLGEIVLSGLRQAPRGAVKIGVTFMLDADGTLGVRATDLDTGREQVIRIQLVGGMSEAEIQSLAERQQQMLG